jgi:hypothetical protein
LRGTGRSFTHSPHFSSRLRRRIAELQAELKVAQEARRARATPSPSATSATHWRTADTNASWVEGSLRVMQDAILWAREKTMAATAWRFPCCPRMARAWTGKSTDERATGRRCQPGPVGGRAGGALSDASRHRTCHGRGPGPRAGARS